MFDRYDPRWGDDPRDRDLERPDVSRGSRAGGDPREPHRRVDPREVFTQQLRLPRGDARERVYLPDRAYDLRGSESRMLATVGAFRVVSASDLRDRLDRPADPVAATCVTFPKPASRARSPSRAAASPSSSSQTAGANS